MEYSFSCGLFDIFLYFQLFLGGGGKRRGRRTEVVVFEKKNENRKSQRKGLGFPSIFGSDWRSAPVLSVRKCFEYFESKAVEANADSMKSPPL